MRRRSRCFQEASVQVFKLNPVKSAIVGCPQRFRIVPRLNTLGKDRQRTAVSASRERRLIRD